MRSPTLHLSIAALCGSMLLPLAARAAENSAPVQATWKIEEIRYSYIGFTTAYSCDAAEDRLKAILRALGAHERTRVLAQGCDLSRPSRNFFISIATAVPVPLAGSKTDSNEPAAGNSRDELLKRLGVAPTDLDETFAAQWKTIELARDRKLGLQPGDCELMKGVRDHVLPKLSVKVVTDRVNCVPRQLTYQTPELTVSALVPMATPDAPGKPRN